MAFTLTLLLEPTTIDKTSGLRKYRLYDPDASGGITLELARAVAPLLGLPAYGTIWSSDRSDLLVSNILYSQNDNSVLIDVIYGQNDASGELRPKVDILAPAFRSMDISFRVDNVEIPAYEVTKLRIKGDDDPVNIIEKDVWTPAEGIPKLQKTSFVFTYRVNGEFISNLSVNSWLNIASGIRAEANKLHTFGGIEYLFQPKTIHQETGEELDLSDNLLKSKFRIEYNWIYDPGILLPLNVLTEAALYPDGSSGVPNLRRFRPVDPQGQLGDTDKYFPVFSENIWIPPNHSVFMNADRRGPEYPPIPTFVKVFRSNPNGYLNLPGILI